MKIRTYAISDRFSSYAGGGITSYKELVHISVGFLCFQ